MQKTDATTRIMMLQSYAEAVIYRDIIERHEIASVQALKYVLQYLLHNFARKISVRAISGVLRQLSLPSDREALSNYLSYYSDSYFAYPVPLRTDSLAVRRTNPDKYYLVDTRMEMVHRKIEVENVANVEVLPMPIPIPNWNGQHWKLQ